MWLHCVNVNQSKSDRSQIHHSWCWLHFTLYLLSQSSKLHHSELPIRSKTQGIDANMIWSIFNHWCQLMVNRWMLESSATVVRSVMSPHYAVTHILSWCSWNFKPQPVRSIGFDHVANPRYATHELYSRKGLTKRQSTVKKNATLLSKLHF